MTSHARLLAGLPLFRGLDPAWLSELAACMERVYVRGGETLMVQGDPGDAMYVLVYGRLRAFGRAASGEERALNDVVAGDAVGELALLTTGVRTSTVRALRDSLLLRLPAHRFQAMVVHHPEALLEITRAAILRLHRPKARTRMRRTFALVAAGASVIDDVVWRGLLQALQSIDTAVIIGREDFEAALGPGAASTPMDGFVDAEMIEWFHRVEESHAVVVYRADSAATTWSERCLRKADAVLYVGVAGAATTLNALETSAMRLLPEGLAADATLMLVQDDAQRLPTDSAAWVEHRSVKGIVHLRRGRQADYERLARLLTGRATGLTLSGGAARGFAHVGVLRAIESLGIPVDAVSGTSFGAVVGAGAAMDWDHRAVRDELVRATVRDGSLLDFTLPIVSLTRGKRLTDRLRRAFGDVCIEDLWRPYACVSTDMSSGRIHVHVRGAVWKALRASAAIPGIFPPVRSPDGSVLLDGSLTGHLPADAVRGLLRGGRVIGVELKAPPSLRAEDLPSDGVVSGWQAGWSRWTSLRQRPRVPTLIHVLAGTSELGMRSAGDTMGEDDLLLVPPVAHIGMLRFDRCDEAIEAGYRHAMERLPVWLERMRDDSTAVP